MSKQGPLSVFNTPLNVIHAQLGATGVFSRCGGLKEKMILVVSVVVVVELVVRTGAVFFFSSPAHFGLF